MPDDQTEKKYAVLAGNVSDGFTLYGPFNLRECDSFCSSTSRYTTIMTLHPDPDVPVKPAKPKPAELLEEEKEVVRNAARCLAHMERSFNQYRAARDEAFKLTADLDLVAKHPLYS